MPGGDRLAPVVPARARDGEAPARLAFDAGPDARPGRRGHARAASAHAATAGPVGRRVHRRAADPVLDWPGRLRLADRVELPVVGRLHGARARHLRGAPERAAGRGQRGARDRRARRAARRTTMRWSWDAAASAGGCMHGRAAAGSGARRWPGDESGRRSRPARSRPCASASRASPTSSPSSSEKSGSWPTRHGRSAVGVRRISATTLGVERPRQPRRPRRPARRALARRAPRSGSRGPRRGDEQVRRLVEAREQPPSRSAWRRPFSDSGRRSSSPDQRSGSPAWAWRSRWRAIMRAR